MQENKFRRYGQHIAVTGSPEASGARCFEVLLRLQEADSNLIPPMAFLPAAERYDLAAQIDRWVIQNAFDIFRRVPFSKSNTQISINLSSATLIDSSLLDFVSEQFRAPGISPKQICFEIAESTLIAQSQEVGPPIAKIRELGCRVAVDNFAGGLSSFHYLKHHPVDLLKIDGRMVQSIDSSPLNYAMVESIHRMAHALGIQTVAASVETPAILEKLEAIGVNYVQGYAVHKPEPMLSLR